MGDPATIAELGGFGSLSFQSSLAQLGIPLNDVIKVLIATMLLGNVLFYEAKNQELSMQGAEGEERGLGSVSLDSSCLISLLLLQMRCLQTNLM